METKQEKSTAFASFNRFEIEMPKDAVSDIAQQGSNDEAVSYWQPKIKINATQDQIRAELKEYGAWESEELKDDAQNLKRILWIGAWNIHEESESWAGPGQSSPH